jgi:hypothetical protein
LERKEIARIAAELFTWIACLGRSPGLPNPGYTRKKAHEKLPDLAIQLSNKRHLIGKPKKVF